LSNNELLKKVLLLAIYKKERDVSLNELFTELVEIGTMSQKELDENLKIIESENLFLNNQLTFIGISEAKMAEESFKM
jgi:hypothetical protein